MKRLKRSLSLRSSRRHIPESHRPQVWENDSYKVRNGGVSFPVKYAGSIEVTESRGTQVCAEAFRRMKDAGVQKKKRMTLLVTSDCIRVVDEETKSLVIDQTIEKVSFCTPDPSDERVFSYICREGTTRRWMCHCFIATRDSGERLSHAVGCAFTACLQRKQKAQALQAQATKSKEGSQSQEGQTATTTTTTTTTTTPSTSLGAVATTPQQQTTLKQLAATATPTTPISASPIITGASSSMNGPTPAAIPSQSVAQPLAQPQPQVISTQQQSPVQPVLKPPPAVVRPRPQPFAPSPFTRHMSLRYKSTPMSLGPLRDNVKGYEALHEEAQAPKLPQTVDALIGGMATQVPQQPLNYPGGFAPQGSSTSPGLQTTPMYNGLQSTSTMNTSYGIPAQNVASPAQPFGGQAASPWTPPPSQLQRTPSDAERWLESAEKMNKINGGNQGLLTTVNPFSASSTQNNGISGTWTQDMNASLPAARQTNPNVWGKTSVPTVPEEPDEFESLATRHTGSPVASPVSKNPFSQGSQVYWV